MPNRRPRDGVPRRRWPFYLLFAAALLVGAALWAYSPSLPPELLIARYASQESRFIDVGGVNAHVRDQGKRDGIPVVLIHGSMGSLHMWEGWVRELGQKARLISVDLPGHGLTGAWPREEYTIDAYADFIEVLVDTLDLDRFVLVGHSMGGAVAWTFAATRPDRVSQLVLVDAAGYPRTGEAPLPTRLARMAVIGDIGIYFKPERLVRRSLTEVYADPAMVTPERVTRYAELQRFPGNREATVLRARTQEPLDPTPLKRMTVPTLLLWGGKDRWVPLADAYRFQGDIKGSKLVVFDTLGHNPMEEDPVGTAAAVAQFLAPITPRPLPPDPATIDHTVHPAVVPERD
ncbi:MAG: alpha/beta hydrolase [Reyranellaceae bacterium]